MKNFLLFTGLGLLLSISSVSAQGIRIMPGTTFKMIGNPYNLVLSNGAHFENNVAVDATLLTIKATGSAQSHINGSGTLALASLNMSHNPGQSLLLQKDINIAGNLTFNTGLLDLNNRNIILADTGMLVNESETSHAVGASGGYIQISQNLDAPLAINPGNLGLVIVSGANWGNTIVRRGHKTHVVSGSNLSISRTFEVIPTTNTNLFSFLRAYYLDAELNALPENTLNFYQSDNGGTVWTDKGAVGRNSTQNFVNINGIQTMSLFTFAAVTTPLALQLTSINSACVNNKPRIKWSVANPQNIRHFQVEKSNDSKTWIASGDPIMAKNSTDYEYQFIDVSEPMHYYRLQCAEYNGTSSFSPVQTVNCTEAANAFNLIQNPVQDGALRINVKSEASMNVNVAVYDINGRELLVLSQAISSGSTQLSTNISSLAPGTYQVKITDRNELLWGTKFVKL